jgi:hypothetical protein
MARFALRVVIACALIVTGWMAGQAQTPAPPTPDFEITVVAPQGWMSVACTRGCEFGVAQVRQDGVVTRGRIPSFEYRCGGTAATCESKVSGWVVR